MMTKDEEKAFTKLSLFAKKHDLKFIKGFLKEYEKHKLR